MTGKTRIIAFGPHLPGFGSWDWVGADTVEMLAPDYETCTFDTVPPANCDVAVFVKFKPPLKTLRQIAHRCRVIYCPIDFYGSGADIDADADSLACCDLVLVHCQRLQKYFSAYAPSEYIDHHLKFTADLRQSFRSDGPILWVGVRSNLPALAEWVNRHPLPEELIVLTNLEEPASRPSPIHFGFRADLQVTIENWTSARQIELTSTSRGALDVKAQDFRARHKPPAKALDYLASGIPFMIQRDGSTWQHLASLGFQAATLEEPSRWRSRGYWEETQAFGAWLREKISTAQLTYRWRQIIEAQPLAATESKEST